MRVIKQQKQLFIDRFTSKRESVGVSDDWLIFHSSVSIYWLLETESCGQIYQYHEPMFLVIHWHHFIRSIWGHPYSTRTYTVHRSRGIQLSIRVRIYYCCTIALDASSLRPSDAYTHRQTNHHWFRWCVVSWTAPSHYLNQCWNTVNRTTGNKLQLFYIAIHIFSFQKMY